MHALHATGSIRSYYLDLVYLNATLQAAGHADLARAIQDELNSLKHQRLEYERAEELEVISNAAVAGRDLTLDESLKAVAAHVKAHHPEDFPHYFAKSPSRLAEAAYRVEIQAVRTVVARLATLPHDDVVRVGFEARLTRAVEELEHALGQRDEVLQGFALVRASLDRVRAHVNVVRLETHAKLVERTKDKKAADRFFQPAPSASAKAQTTPAAPADGAPHA